MHEQALKNRGSLRSEETQAKYDKHLSERHLRTGCPLCKESGIVEFKYWNVITNNFPYDATFSVHEMLIPKRHTDGSDLTLDEINELTELKKGFLNDNYQYIIEALPSSKSVPTHFHLHLVITK